MAATRSGAVVLAIRMRRDVYERLKAASRAAGIGPVGPWMRAVAMEHASYVLDPAPPEYIRAKIDAVRRNLTKKVG